MTRLQFLAYVIGVILKGDGSVYAAKRYSKNREKTSMRYEISLRAKSLEFVMLFSQRCAVVLKRPTTAIQGPYADGCYVSKYTSADFYFWWTRVSFDEIRQFVERFPVQYLGGRFDSEIGVGDYAVYMHGAISHSNVLELDHALCIKLGMRTGPMLPYGKEGKNGTISGREIVSKEQRLRFSVNATDFLRFMDPISVKERREKLQRMIKGRVWTPWSEGTRDRALDLLGRGNSPKEVSDKLQSSIGVKVPPITIYYWSRGTKSWTDYSKVSLRRRGLSMVKTGDIAGGLGP